MTTPSRTRRLFSFGEFELDEGRGELRRRIGHVVELEPVRLSLLLYLVRERRRVVPKEELVEQVWGVVSLSDDAVTSAVRDVRKALGDDARDPRWIRTHSKRGYEFIGEVRVLVPDEAQPKGALHGVPRGLSVCFTGRTEALARLEALLGRESYAGVSVAIEGMAGVGKTELALQLVHKLAQERKFAGGICWLDAQRGDLGPAWSTAIADAYGIPKGALEDEVSQACARWALAGGC